jgi:hypothetical protein
MRLLMKMAADGDRFLFMTPDKTLIVNEDSGTWDSGLWYSSSYKPYVYKDYKGSSSYAPYAGSYSGGSRPVAPPVTVATTTRNDGSTTQESFGVIPVQVLAATVETTDGEFARVMEARGFHKDVEPHLLLPGGPNVMTGTPGTMLGDEVGSGEFPMWEHQGHHLARLMDMPRDKDANYFGGVVCNDCYTMGDIAMVDGVAYADIVHLKKGDVVSQVVSDDELTDEQFEAVLARMEGVH